MEPENKLNTNSCSKKNKISKQATEKWKIAGEKTIAFIFTHRRAIVLVISLLAIFGVPILINECYKHGGYITMWEAADVLSYYGAILGASITVGTLAITILFTRKQIQRESYLKDKKEVWSRLDEKFTSALKSISPIPPMEECIDKGGPDPSEAIAILQIYQMSCRTALDEILPYLSGEDYLKVKDLISSITAMANQCFDIAKEESSAYKKIQDLNGRDSAQRTIDMETQHPGSFPEQTLSFCRELIQNTDGLSYEIASQEIGKINEKIAALYEESYRPLLALKRTTFEKIDNEVQKEADSILQLWRK